MPLRRRSLAAAWVLVLLALHASNPSTASAAGRSDSESTTAPASPSPARGLVVVLRPAELTETMRVVLARITGELAAASFQVRVESLDLQKDPTQAIQAAVLEGNAIAGFALGGSRDSLTIWIFERPGLRTTVQRVPVRRGGFAQDAKVSALKAVELIRASLADVWPDPAPPAATAPTAAAAPLAPPAPSAPPSPPPSPPIPAASPGPPSAPAPPSPAPTSPPAFPSSTASPASPAGGGPAPPPASSGAAPPSVVESPSAPLPPPGPADPWPPSPGLTLGLGVAGLWDLRSAPQWMGSLQVELRLRPRLALQARVTGLGPSQTIPAADSSVTIDRGRGSLGAGWSFWSASRLYVSLVAAVGAERVRASGSSTDRTRFTQSDTAWTPIGLVGLTATTRLARHWSVTARVEGEWAWSRVELTIGDWRTQPLARPGVLSEIALQAIF